MTIETNQVTKPGQIKKGDLLLLKDRNGVVFPAVAKSVIFEGTSTEEIIISLSRNLYFIMSMYLEGKSWVKDCCIIPNGEAFSLINNNNHM